MASSTPLDSREGKPDFPSGFGEVFRLDDLPSEF
jgi:hypothetical protein